MRKFLFTLWMLVVCCAGYAQTIDALFDEFAGERNADCVKVSPLMMSIGKMFCKHDEGMEGLHKIRSVKVLDLGECSAKVKERFNGKVRKLNQKGYEELMRVNDEGDKVRILMKTKKNVIRELLVVCSGNDDCTLIQINGKFAQDDIDGLVNMETGKKHGCR